MVYKITQDIYIVKISLAAYYLVLLSGDVNPNPGPVSNSHNFEFPKARGLKLAHLNVRSLVNKIDDVRCFIDKNPFDIFTISQSWLNSSISDSEISLSGYTLVRQDRKDKSGGGTAIYVHDGIPYTHRPDLSIGGIETCWIVKLFVSSVYRAPDVCPHLLITGLNELLKVPLQ